MGARGETFAKQFEAKVRDATAAIERLTDAEWKKVTTAEKWPVGVVAHHIASAHQTLSGLVKMLADGKPGPNISMDVIHAGNAKHAQEFANVSKADTLALHKQNAEAATAILRGIADAEFDRSGAVLNGVPPMSAGQLAGGLLCGHMDEHLGSIKATVGR
jgi:DinB superfamily